MTTRAGRINTDWRASYAAEKRAFVRWLLISAGSALSVPVLGLLLQTFARQWAFLAFAPSLIFIAALAQTARLLSRWSRKQTRLFDASSNNPSRVSRSWNRQPLLVGSAVVILVLGVVLLLQRVSS
jgi:hypothetical protein